MNTELTADRLRELMGYDSESGAFTWRLRQVTDFPDERAAKSWNSQFAGKKAGGINKITGYVLVGADGQRKLAHRLAFLWMTGKWPTQQVDHINGDKADNRWSNLRDVSCAVNLQNLRSTKRKDKSTGFLGAFQDKRDGRFQAQIRVHGKVHSLGRFDTAHEAHLAYLTAKRRMHEGCTL